MSWRAAKLAGQKTPADEVLAKHDETYMPREVAERLKERGEWRPQTPGARP